MADAVVGFIFNSAKEFVLYNAALIGGVPENVLKLCDDLVFLKGYLRDCTEGHEDSNILQGLASEVQNVVHQVEDAIEQYIFYASRQKLRGKVERFLHSGQYATELRNLGSNMESVRKRIDDFCKNRAPLGIEAMKLVDKPTTPKVYSVEEENVVGFQDAAEDVIKLLMEDTKELQVISIIGMLGLGKTTLARKIFNDPRIKYEFLARAFVNVSQQYERKEIFIKILEGINQLSDDMHKMSDKKLEEVIREKLQTRHYLIVMDDVWTEQAWDDLNVVFPNNGKGSRVLITSRHTSVAIYANQNKDPYRLRFMTDDESRELLCRKVFGKNDCPKEFQKYEECILLKCKGLPLAIVVIAGILLNNRDRVDWWRDVAEGVKNYNPADQERSIELIKLSFRHLPYHLKPCFLYLGLFREDFEIPVWKLLRLWVAEGLIPENGKSRSEDIAESYLEELVDRNLVMVGSKRLNGHIKTCRIHDTLRDFCEQEATKENLFHEIKGFNKATYKSANPHLDTYRRLCINSNILDYVTSKPSGERVRSFLSFAREKVVLPTKYISAIPKGFNLLRVLDVTSIRFDELPSELYYLILLKYISICCNLRILPEKMSNLWNLQTLIFETSSSTLLFEADIWKMAQLRHVHLKSSTKLQKGKEGSSTNPNLQTFSAITPESCIEVIERSPNLRKLAIRGILAPYFQAAGGVNLFGYLLKLEFLDNLKLLNDDATSKLDYLPSEEMFPKRLTRLTLSKTKLDWRYMSTLEKLKMLQVLKLKENAFDGQFWEMEDKGFPCLEVLHIESTELVVWTSTASHFPKLKSLFLRHCKSLKAIPRDFANIDDLQMIDLHRTSSSVANSARQIKELKLELQAQKSNSKGSGFKLLVFPQDL